MARYKEIHTIKSLEEGFERFKQENGHYPGSEEVDSCPYLCNSKTIQRKFGGMSGIRRLLNIMDSDHSSGDNRSEIGFRINRLAIKSEKEVGELLRSIYGEICVHEEKRYGDGRNRVDFYIYANPSFAVEVFNTYTLKHLATILNMKLDKFYNFPVFIYFVVTGNEFPQDSIELMISKKKKHFPDDKMKCVSFHEFKDCCRKHLPLQIKLQSKML